MLIAEDLVLLVTEDETGKTLASSMNLEPALGGAVLLDLVLAGRVDLEGEGRQARAVVLDPAPLSDPILTGRLRRFAEKAPMKPQAAVSRLGKGVKDELYESLAARGVLRREEGRTLGLFPRTRWPAADSAHEADLRQQITAALLHGQDPPPPTAALIAVLSSGDLLRHVVERPDRKAAAVRADQIAEGNWAGVGVRRAIQASQAAIMAAVVASTAATSSAGGS